ncbi:DUF6162 family protein [Pollutimonas bauzanensis]|uniref:Uncharacterized protein n=1 Tax=Pollutimonas bauzanensis TaxID=658167 RepID=A0A1M6A7S2_9BURK|nr:DUF6162 family protein [Pollutimonas bauzanensis]SHI32476.1 hypothetical protein SAMN04488135_12143 [Pollutimonas bauzanensis]
MTVQVVKPAGAGPETLLVLAWCALILAMAGAFVFWRVAPAGAVGVQAHQMDARRDLTAAEQGIYADLRVAFDEIQAAGGASAPAVQDLADSGLPPFARDASASQRGGHAWQLAGDGAMAGYAGLSADRRIAGAMLLRMPPSGAAHDARRAHGHDAADARLAEPDIWLNREAGADAPAQLDDAALISAGWRQIVAQFDASVTRQRRQP